MFVSSVYSSVTASTSRGAVRPFAKSVSRRRLTEKPRKLAVTIDGHALRSKIEATNYDDAHCHCLPSVNPHYVNFVTSVENRKAEIARVGITFLFFFISRTLYISFSLSPAFLYVRDSSHGSLFHRPHDRQRYIARARCVSISTRRDCAERKREAAAKRLRGKAEYRGVSQSITQIELSRSWQRTDREYATLYVVLRIASERERNREGEAAREGQTAAREGADHVVKLTVYKPRRRSRGHVLIKNLAHCEERIFEFVAWRFLRGTLLRKLFAPGYGWPCRVAFRTRSRTRSRLVEQARLSMSSLLRNHRLSSYFSSMFPDRVLPTPSVFSN